MTLTLFDATLELSKILQNTVEGTATGGSMMSLQDVLRPEASDYFDGGTIWFRSGSLKGKSARISDWMPPTFMFDAQSAGVVAGDRYAAAPSDYPRWLLVQKINQALRTLIPLEENESLVVVAYQEQYTLPAGVFNIKRVEVSTQTSEPIGYVPNYNWREKEGKLEFDADHAPTVAGQTIRLYYLPGFDELINDADVIDDRVPLLHLVWSAAVYALRWRVGLTRGDEPDKIRQLNEAIINAERMAGMYPSPAVARDPHLATW